MGTDIPVSGSIQPDLVEVLKSLFPVKTWGYLADLVQINERCAKHRIAGSRAFTADELALMLRSEHGLAFLSAAMGDAAPRWWVSFKQRGAITSARRFEAAARRQLQEALDAEADLSAAIAHTDALLDQDFVRPHADALRSMSRIPNRPVASPAKSTRR